MHRPIKNIDKFNNTTIYNPGADKHSNMPNHHKIEI